MLNGLILDQNGYHTSKFPSFLKIVWVLLLPGNGFLCIHVWIFMSFAHPLILKILTREEITFLSASKFILEFFRVGVPPTSITNLL